MSKVQMSTEFQFFVRIDNLTEFNSPDFEAGGVLWKIIIIRKISNDHETDDIHVFLSCDYEASRQTWTGWWIDAMASVTLISNKDNNSLQKIISKTRFGKNHSMFEIEKFISWKDLITEHNGFIENGNFSLHVNLSSTLVQKRINFREEKNRTIEIEPEFIAIQNEKFQGKKGQTKRK